ncbi:F-box/FBD/LRR-repeat protein-like protein [Drosera capensis]
MTLTPNKRGESEWVLVTSTLEEKKSSLEEGLLQNRVAMKDQISGLPDDVILIILSHLELKDAARTSLLSKRWRYSWTYMPDLDFDAEKFLRQGFDNNAGATSRYVKWVSDVIMAHRAPTVKKFRVFFHLDGTYASDIDRWVDFCSRKGVNDLEMNFHGLCSKWHDKFYNLGTFGQTIHHPQAACAATFPFNNLMSLSLKMLSISGASLEFMLSKCSHLERLWLNCCDGLGSLTVAGSPLKLKYLNIKLCEVDKVEASAPNLVTVEFWDFDADIIFKCVPSLVEASFLGECANDMLKRISCWSFQLEKLTMVINETDSTPTSIPSLVNVKELMVTLDIEKGHNLHNWCHLIDACLSLREFKLGISWVFPLFNRNTHEWRVKATDCILPCLEIFHFVGFAASEFDIGFASYVIERAPLLKTLALCLRDPLIGVRDPIPFSLAPSGVKHFVGELAKSHPALDVIFT